MDLFIQIANTSHFELPKHFSPVKLKSETSQPSTDKESNQANAPFRLLCFK